MQTKFKIIPLILVVVMVLSMTGCKDENADPLLSSSKEELVALIHSTNQELELAYSTITDQDTTIQELEDRIRGQVSSEKPPAGIGEVAAGIKLTFNTIDDKIVFPVDFTYPGSTQAANTTSIHVSSNVTLSPTSNWVTKIVGGEIQLYHANGINGVISTGELDREARKITVDTLEQYLLDNFFVHLPPETITFSRLHLRDDWVGVDAVSPTTIDEEPAMLRCGIMKYGEQSIQYFFVYRGERDTAKDENIISLMNTFKIQGNELSIVE